MSASHIPRQVIVVIGTGGMGLAVARRIASGKSLVLADYSEKALQSSLELLKGNGFSVTGHLVDVSDLSSVKKLAVDAAALGPLAAVIQTAGVSPVQAPLKAIYSVDLLGTANVIEAFESVVGAGTSVVCISSAAGYQAQLSPELEKHFATAPVSSLLYHTEISHEIPAGYGYCIAKKANQLRVQAASLKYGLKGARINSISPGVISTPMGMAEMEGEHGAHVKAMISMCGAKRVGTPDDIAGVVAFLVGGDSSYITGNDILVDGGSTMGMKHAGV